jgi:hypothetical protein
MKPWSVMLIWPNERKLIIVKTALAQSLTNAAKFNNRKL